MTPRNCPGQGTPGRFRLFPAGAWNLGALPADPFAAHGQVPKGASPAALVAAVTRTPG